MKMQNDQRGRTSRTSSTSSLGREVRCGCQFYQSDSLLPERRALLSRPLSRTNMIPTPPPHISVPHSSEHEYEPISPPLPPPPPITNMVAPVVRITDTDVMPVADSDDSIDDHGRFHSGLILDGDIILPLDGRLEDSAMEGRELGETIDTSDEQESAQQLQDRLEENFLSALCPDIESRTETEINDDQVGSSVLQELPEKHSFQQKLRSQAGKLRSRLGGIQRPAFTKPARSRSAKKKAAPVNVAEKSKSVKASKMERFKMALPERPRFSFPDTSKLSMPNRPKFNIKRPNIHLPSALKRSQKDKVSTQDQQRQRSTESTYGSRKNIFDFSTYPRIFDKKLKNKAEYATSSPKESRAQSAESATFPRTKMTLKARWTQRFGDTRLPDELSEQRVAIERSHPWRHPSLEEPRLAFKTRASESLEESEKLPWQTEQKSDDYRDEIQYADYEEDSQEPSEQKITKLNERTKIEESFNNELTTDSRLYADKTVDQVIKEIQYIRDIENSEKYDQSDEEIELEEVEQVEVSKIRRMESSENSDFVDYESSFPPVDPRRFQIRKMSYEERSSVRSDGEQQESGGSSCERRRQGVIEDDMSDRKYVVSEIREAIKKTPNNAPADENIPFMPPQRPSRTRSLRKRNDDSSESFDDLPPAKPKRERILRRSEESIKNLERTGSFSSAAHKVVYQTDIISREQSPAEHLDDIVVVKPARRKSRLSLGSQSITASSTNIQPSIPINPNPPVVPTRVRRNPIQNGNDNSNSLHQNGSIHSICNGHNVRNILENSMHQNHPTTPTPSPSFEPTLVNQQIIENLALRFKPTIFEGPPIPPKRRSRSRTTSFIQDDDRTSHGAESIPEIGYIEDEIPQDDSREQLPGYAVIEKYDKPPRPPPPRRQRHKFATTPRPAAPKRPRKAYSTLGPAKKNHHTDTDPTITRSSEDITQYIEIDSDEEHRNLRSGEVLNKMQGRPLPAPPRPPRSHRAVKENLNDHESEFTHSANEAVASTQTDPLPDDIVIEEEITQAKLIMTPSRHGSQMLITTERIPTPTLSQTSIPPNSHLSTIQPPVDSKISDNELENRPISYERVEENNQRDPGDMLRAALFSDEPLRINSLEVGDLRVDRLNVSHLEAYKIAASEIDAIVVSASEMSGRRNEEESGMNPSLLQELIAIRSHLENVVKVQERPSSTMEDACIATSNEQIDLITSTVRTQDSIRTSPEQEIESAPKTETDRLNIVKMSTTQTKAKQVTEQKTKSASESEILKTQVLQVDNLKPDVEITANFGRATFSSTSTSRESSVEKDEKYNKKLRSRSASPSSSRGSHAVRQTASPVKSLPPLISVTPDTTVNSPNDTTSPEALPQRAIISYSERREQPSQEINQFSQENSLPGATHFVAFQTSQIPAQFFSLASPTTQQVEAEPHISETTLQFFRSIRIIGIRTMRHFVNYLASRVGREESSDKIKEVELVLCALLLIVAGLLIMLFGSPRTVTHHHHWDYFNPPQ